jgi:uncharacterized protein
MIHERQAYLLLFAFCVLLPACGTSTPRYYRLDTTATGGGTPSVPAKVMVGPVSVPAAVDRPQFVVGVDPNRVEVEEFDRWAAPLDDSIARTVAGDLSVLLGSPSVAAGPLANFNPSYSVTINVQRFDSVRGEAAVVDAVWTVRSAAGNTRSGRTIARETVQGQGFDALAAAHSRAIAQLSSDIAGAIRSEAAANM